jgi:translation initiation factor IF-2
LRIIIKGDTHGSIEALKASIEQIDVEGTKIDVIRASVGTITETDVTLALASEAIIVGFNVRPPAQVRDDAKEKGVQIRLYNIIYKALEEIEQALTGMLDPIFEEVVTGEAEVRDTFKISKVGTVAGCYVTNGVIERNSLVRIIRDGIVVYEGKMSSLKRFKDDAKEVRTGFECGIMIERFNDIKVGDIIEASVEREVKRK